MVQVYHCFVPSLLTSMEQRSATVAKDAVHCPIPDLKDHKRGVAESVSVDYIKKLTGQWEEFEGGW